MKDSMEVANLTSYVRVKIKFTRYQLKRNKYMKMSSESDNVLKI